MRNKLAYAVILTAAAACLSGCSYRVATGPCFGTGCPSRTVGKSGQYKVGEGPKTAAITAPASKASPASPQKTQGK